MDAIGETGTAFKKIQADKLWKFQINPHTTYQTEDRIKFFDKETIGDFVKRFTSYCRKLLRINIASGKMTLRT